MTSPSDPTPPGWPGIPPRWTSSAKSGVGTALRASGRTWFTLSHGIVNEVYYSRIDQACTRDLGLIVTDGVRFFSEEKRHTQHEVTTVADGIPAFRVVNTCREGRYRIEKEILADPSREVVLQRITFVPLVGTLSGYSVHVLLAPHLENAGNGNTAWVDEVKGVPMLLAVRNGTALALACSAGWKKRSAGFVGVSDGWQDLRQHSQMEWTYDRAENGNVALTGEVDLMASRGQFVLALGFGLTHTEAGHRAIASLWDGFDKAAADYRGDWEAWQRTLRPLERPRPGARDLYRVSTAVLRTHESSRFPGGLIASLSIPWGFSKDDGDLGGYHLAWPRDLVESAGGLLAAGALEEVGRILRYLAVTQEADGHWPQNMWLDGAPYWNGIQMDETGFPILLVDLARRSGALAEPDLARLWPMVRRAAGFLVQNGPVTQQDRWEEDPGYSPFTLAVEVAALLCAADLADQVEPGLAAYLRETADAWNAAIERWTYVTGTDLARELGVDGYYVRIAPTDAADAASPATGFVPIKNRPPGQSAEAASHIISPDALALVRFGLRAADDPRIVNTVKAIDSLLKVDTPSGPLWRRYNGDGYGEHQDGSPFDGTGIGRPWPLLTGERAHYELAAGRLEEAEALTSALSRFANEGGLLPEQTWDGADSPEHELVFGKPTGSAMPLVWAHAEYVKLCRSLADGRVFDMPPQPVQRYQVLRVDSPHAIWRFNHKCLLMPFGKRLRLEVLEPALVHWSPDGWRTIIDTPTCDTGLGIHVADLPSETLQAGVPLNFTFFWPAAARWEGRDFTVTVAPPTSSHRGRA
ncbi:glucan 1,4-alpha-glucosidase [Geothrix limicola]|uniref:Glucan 1,4-alpha-glucosidase n=1 Tax=Geothrix limicola TaxID=2927978 RepID=A0ABQ5QEZ3_9BACT|nr:glucan 1,4-alpha-glucosidase [Geothrix limicola]GLH73419.1 glucan 1,4-alpha-glucosidase [Geothrix limicola]